MGIWASFLGILEAEICNRSPWHLRINILYRPKSQVDTGSMTGGQPVPWPCSYLASFKIHPCISVRSFVRPSVPIVLKNSQKKVQSSYRVIYMSYAVSYIVHPWVSQSIGPSIGLSIGLSIGPSASNIQETKWMHRCLPFRLFFSVEWLQPDKIKIVAYNS